MRRPIEGDVKTINNAKAVSFGLALCQIASFSACGGSSSQSTNSSSNMAATVNITVSDPHTCARPSGPFAHSYVTITDVQIQASSSAGPNDPGSSAEAIFPRCQANLIEEFERSPPFAYLRSGCRVRSPDIPRAKSVRFLLFQDELATE